MYLLSGPLIAIRVSNIILLKLHITTSKLRLLYFTSVSIYRYTGYLYRYIDV